MPPLKVTDDLGRSLVFIHPPRRVVSLVPSDTHSVIALGAGDRLVGRTTWCEHGDGVATVGGTMAIYAAIRAFVGRGDNAVIVSPAYAIFSNAVIMSGGEPRPASLALHRGRFALNLDRVRAAIDANTRMLIVNSPSNPTGWVISEDEQRALV